MALRDKILAVLFILSTLVSIYLAFLILPAQKNIQELQNRTNNLEKTNAELSKQVYQGSEAYKRRVAYLEGSLNSTPTYLQRFAELQAPAVMQKVEYIQDYPFVRQ